MEVNVSQAWDPLAMDPLAMDLDSLAMDLDPLAMVPDMEGNTSRGFDPSQCGNLTESYTMVTSLGIGTVTVAIKADRNRKSNSNSR